tara:strand:- start:9315 stop:10841 length:1527 start_codon:yes stop_codon:yes gene_type:complete
MSDKNTNEVTIVEQVSSLPTLAGWKDKALQAVQENPFTKIVDAATSKTARANRTALVKARTELGKQRTTINKNLAEIRDAVKDETNKLIEITLPHEERQQVEIDSYDEIKKEEKARKLLVEENRVKMIKGRIEDTEFDCTQIIVVHTLENHDDTLETLKEKIASGQKTGEVDFDFMEFEVLYEDMERRMTLAFEDSTERLKKEAAEILEQLSKDQKAEIDSVYRHCTEMLFADGFTVADIRRNFNEVLEEADNFDFGEHNAVYLTTKDNILKQFKVREVQLQEAEKMEQREARMKELEKLQEYKIVIETAIGNIILENEDKYTTVVRTMLNKPSLDTDLIVPEWEAFLIVADKKIAARKKVLENEQDVLNAKAVKEQERIDKRTKERRADLRVIGLEPTENGLHFIGSGASIPIAIIRTADDTVFAEHRKNAVDIIANFKVNDAAAKREAKKLQSDVIVLDGFINNLEIDFTPIGKLKSTEGKALANDIEQEFRLWLSNTKLVIDNVK